jgi:hypothetical protein
VIIPSESDGDLNAESVAAAASLAGAASVHEENAAAAASEASLAAEVAASSAGAVAGVAEDARSSAADARGAAEASEAGYVGVLAAIEAQNALMSELLEEVRAAKTPPPAAEKPKPSPPDRAPAEQKKQRGRFASTYYGKR